VSPRVDPEALLIEAEALLPKRAEVATTEETAATLKAARDALASASRDLARNVYSTDTTAVVKRMITFTENLRAFLGDVPGLDTPRSEFKLHTVLVDAHRTLDVLNRHLLLVEHYDKTAELRLTRPTTEVDAELQSLSTRGEDAKKALMELLEVADRSLGNLS
jgi:hypothetical protein